MCGIVLVVLYNIHVISEIELHLGFDNINEKIYKHRNMGWSMHFLSHLDVNAFTFDFMVETYLLTTKREYKNIL